MNTQDERFEEVFKKSIQTMHDINAKQFGASMANMMLPALEQMKPVFKIIYEQGLDDGCKKLEGCVVVPKDKIEVWWQDSEEPENFATKEDDLPFVAQHIQDDETMEINEHHTIHLPSITKFGAWIYKNGQRKFFVGTKDEVEAARGGNE